jgi:hypothetical protein
MTESSPGVDHLFSNPPSNEKVGALVTGCVRLEIMKFNTPPSFLLRGWLGSNVSISSLTPSISA